MNSFITSFGPGISGRMWVVALESAEWECRPLCLSTPHWRGDPNGKIDCSPSIRRPRSRRRTLWRCSCRHPVRPGEPSPHDTHTCKNRPDISTPRVLVKILKTPVQNSNSKIPVHPVLAINLLQILKYRLHFTAYCVKKDNSHFSNVLDGFIEKNIWLLP